MLHNEPIYHTDMSNPSTLERGWGEAMKVLSNYIYEYEKGVRKMVLYTFNKEYEDYAVKRLQHRNIDFVVQPAGRDTVNLFFGRKECLNAIKIIVTKPLNELSPEEDFMLGAMLGYDITMECERYTSLKNKERIRKDEYSSLQHSEGITNQNVIIATA